MLVTLMKRIVLFAAVGLISLSARAMADAVKFNLPAGELVEALKALAKQADVEVMYSPEQLKKIHTKGVKGTYSSQEAIQILLKGTALVVHTDATGAMVIALPPPPESTPSGSSTNAPSGDEKSNETTRSRLQLAQEAQGVSGEDSSVRGDENESSRQNEKISGVGLEQVLVTGTHIRGEAPTSTVITIDRNYIDESGLPDVGDLIRSIPQNFSGGNNPNLTGTPAPGSQNSSLAGGSAPDLRGLGPASTLTLVNGHRLAQAEPTGAVDISFIPLSAVEQVEILTEGASATYGSDAVAGVVNFIMRRNFNGAETSAFVGGTSDGGGFEKQFSQLAGHTWSSGSGLVSYEFDDRGEISAGQRDFGIGMGMPTTLAPGTRRNSVFVSGHQDLVDWITCNVDGFYTSRTSDSASTRSLAPNYYAFYEISDVKQSAVTLNLEASLLGQWRANLIGNFASEDSYNNEYDSTSPGAPGVLGVAEPLRGRTKYVEVDADGPMVQLPTGAMKFASGLGRRLEGFSDTYNDVTASRGIDYAYAELSIPLVRPSVRAWINRLDFDLSARYEDYSDTGHKATPKFGLIYKPGARTSVRASWGKSYRAPSLEDKYLPASAEEDTFADPRSPTGFSNALVPEGGSPNLQPETARSWTVSADYSPIWVEGLKATISYYDIVYTNRIARIADVPAALTDPANAAFVSRNPSVSAQQNIIDAANSGFGFYNYTGFSYNPTTVAAIVDNTQRNIAQQDIRGVDLVMDYKFAASIGSIDVFVNGTYLNLQQRVTAESTDQELAGLSFNPARFRTRAGGSWSDGSWGATILANYVGRAINTNIEGTPGVPAWTTFDGQIAYAVPKGIPFSGLHVTVSVQNLFNRNPPTVVFDAYQPGLRYDPTNASPLGRVINMRLIKTW